MCGCLLIPAFSYGADQNLASISEGEQLQILQCPNPKPVNNICASIGSREGDEDPDSPYVYQYQRLIYKAACADKDYEQLMLMDDKQSQSVEAKQLEDEIVRKINLLWDKYEPTFNCNSTQFDVQNGSILKLAVKKLFRDVLEDAVMVWRVNLNRVDASDDRTLLDYVQKEIAKNHGNANEPILKEFYKTLREGGALHRHELPPDSPNLPQNQLP